MYKYIVFKSAWTTVCNSRESITKIVKLTADNKITQNLKNLLYSCLPRRPTEASDQSATAADEDLEHLQNVLLVLVRFPVSAPEDTISSKRVVWVANMLVLIVVVVTVSTHCCSGHCWYSLL